MALVNLQQILQDAQAGGYAVGNFDVCDSDLLMGVMAAAERNRSPVILAYGGDFQRSAPIRSFSKLLRAVAEDTDLPVCIHWDHAVSMEEISLAIDCGFSSVMIDASRDSFERNIAATKDVVNRCRDQRISVEAELGQVGAENSDYQSGEYRYTDPDQAAEFVERTGVDALAIAIGNIHGVYATEPRLKLDLVAQVRSRVDVPLVLHGASGIGDSDIKKCIQGGIVKINIFTELCQAACGSVEASIRAGEKYLTLAGHAIDAVAARAEEKILLFGSNGKGRMA